MVPFPSPWWKQESISPPPILLWGPGRTPGDKTYKSVGSPMIGPLWSFYLSVVHTEPPEIPQSQFQFSCSNTVSHAFFSSGRLWFSVFACLSNCEGRGLPCVLTSLVDLSIFVYFLFCSAFYLLLGQSEHFHIPYMLDQKPEVHVFKKSFHTICVVKPDTDMKVCHVGVD